MTPTALYFLLEGFAIAFFGILGVQNLAHRDERLHLILGGILIYWMAQHIRLQHTDYRKHSGIQQLFDIPPHFYRQVRQVAPRTKK